MIAGVNEVKEIIHEAKFPKRLLLKIFLRQKRRLISGIPVFLLPVRSQGRCFKLIELAQAKSGIEGYICVFMSRAEVVYYFTSLISV